MVTLFSCIDSNALTMTNEQVKPALRRSFLNAYPVLALKLGAGARDALIRHLPMSLRAAFAFEEATRWLEVDWKHLENVATVTEGETWIEIRYVRGDAYFRYDIRSVSEVDHLIYISGEANYSSLGSSTGHSDISGWLRSLWRVHHLISLESEMDRMFKEAGWTEHAEFDWVLVDPIWGSCCLRTNPSFKTWKFWQGMNFQAGFKIDDDNAEEVKYLCTGSENPVSREKWLKNFARCISVLTPHSSIQRNSEPKRLKI